MAARAKKAGLGESATEAEIEAAEKKADDEGKTVKEKQTLIDTCIKKEGGDRIYGDDLMRITGKTGRPDKIEFNGVTYEREAAFYRALVPAK